MINLPGANENETGFFIMTIKYPDWMDAEGGYEKYRAVRSSLCMKYAEGFLERYAHLERIIGIALEPPGQDRGSSEDLIYAEQHDWTDEERATIKNDCKQLGLLQDVTEGQWIGKEFPEDVFIMIERPATPAPHAPQSPLNRKQRRAQKSRARKRDRRFG